MKRTTCLFLLFLLAQVVSAGSKMKYASERKYMYRLTLTDKRGSNYSLSHPTRWLSAKSVERRRRQGLALDSTDLPVSPQYMKTIAAHNGVNIIGKSRWNNTVVALSNDTLALQSLAGLPFVKKAELVWVSPDSVNKKLYKEKYHHQFNPWDSVKLERYGGGKEQIEAVNGHRLHAIGKRGRNMTIAILDGGFQNVNNIPAFQYVKIAEVRDLVWHDPTAPVPANPNDLVYYGSDHGTRVLSAMAADIPEVLTGTAPDATYLLLRCEDLQTEQPVEEDYWAMAAELADSAGADVINSSLGYTEYDAPHQSPRLRDLDGRTTLISRTASMLASKGIVLVSSAGNTGMGPWKKITIPADADDILTVGAVTPEGRNAPFSAVGPSQDGRVKPDVVAVGSPAILISGRGTIVHDMGTSFSAPIVAGLVACLWQALPTMKAADIISLIRRTADNHDAPDNIYGYGKPNFWQAYMVGKWPTQALPKRGVSD